MCGMDGNNKGGGGFYRSMRRLQDLDIFVKNTHVTHPRAQAQDQATLGCDSPPPNGGLQELGG